MIEAIFIANAHSAEQRQVTEVKLIKGSGILGDRNFNQMKWPGQNITFIEIEQIEHFNKNYNQNISFSATRRNIITRGISLNDLLNKKFYIGEVGFIGVELCEPCQVLGRLLENESIARKDVVKAFVHKGGLRSDILSSGRISVGMPFNL